MNRRSTSLSLLGLGLILLGGCAAGAGNGVEGMAGPEQFDEENLPEWVLELPEGIEPSNNEYTNAASLFLLQGQYESALESAQEGIEADPENARSYYQAGEAYLRLGNFEAAGPMFDRAEELYPRIVIETDFVREEAWINAYNDAFEHLPDNPDLAIETLARAHDVYRLRPEAMVLLGSLYQQEGQVDDAIRVYGDAIEMIEHPRFGMTDDEEVRTVWDEDIKIALFNRGQMLFETQRFLEAAETYLALLHFDPEEPGVVTNLAAALASAGAGAQADEIYEELLAREDLSAVDYILIGTGLFEAEELERAAAAFAEAHNRIPWDRDTHLNYAQALYFGELHDELLDVAASLIEADPYNHNAYRFLVQALVMDDRQDEAMEYIEIMEALPFGIEGLHLAGLDDGVAVAGELVNQNADPNSQVEIQVRFYDLEGNELAIESTTVSVGAAGEAEFFQVNYMNANPQDVVGYSYEVSY